MPFPSPAAYVRAESARLCSVHRRNLAIFRCQPWREVSGAFGDLGTFIPIFIALSRPAFGIDSVPAVSAASTLVFSGLANILTGIFFGIPLPVQPMKAIAAVVIAAPAAFPPGAVAGAGLFTAGAVAVLSATGLVRWFSRAIPIPIVKGIQLGAGLSLVMSGIRNFGPLWWGDALSGTARGIEFGALIATALVLLVSTMRQDLPFMGVVMAVAFVFALGHLVSVWIDQGPFTGLAVWRPHFHVPAWRSFEKGAFDAGLGQLPLTTLNSIVAVAFLAEDLLPDAPAPSATAIGLSVAAMNLIGCWFHAMPVCHGSGGLAAQYRCGARSGASIIVLGALKVALGLIASEFVVHWCARFPPAVLGVLLVLAGTEIVKMGENVNGRGARDLWLPVDDYAGDAQPAGGAQRGRDEVYGDGARDGQKRFVEPDAKLRMRRYLLMMGTVAAALGTHNMGVGVLAGLGLRGGFWLQDWEAARQEGSIRIGDEVEARSRAMGE